jgi:hypothetical protein
MSTHVSRASPMLRMQDVADSAPASSRRYDAVLLLACVALILGGIVTSFW